MELRNRPTNGEGNSMDHAPAHPVDVQPAAMTQPPEQKSATEQESTFTREDLRKDTYVRDAEPQSERPQQSPEVPAG